MRDGAGGAAGASGSVLGRIGAPLSEGKAGGHAPEGSSPVAAGSVQGGGAAAGGGKDAGGGGKVAGAFEVGTTAIVVLACHRLQYLRETMAAVLALRGVERYQVLVSQRGLYVCLVCLPYMSALYVCLLCLPSMSALYVCLTRLPSMSALYMRQVFVSQDGNDAGVREYAEALGKQYSFVRYPETYTLNPKP